MSGQSIVDRLNAAKHTVAGSALGRAVVKATTEEVMGPKRKHLECTFLTVIYRKKIDQKIKFMSENQESN
jgi:hypothetical protein